MDVSFKRNDLPYLDGLRALAAMIVVASHFGEKGWAVIGGVSLRETGKSGVYLFFLLSAYLLTRNAFVQGKSFWTRESLSKFFFRRTMRIFPLFILYLLVCVVTTKLAPYVMENPRGFAYTLNWVDFWRHLALQDGVGVLWSIPVEFKYYFLLPVVAFGLWHSVWRFPKSTIVLVAVFCALVEFYLLSRGSRGGGTYLRAYIQLFVIGSAFAAFDVAFFATQTEELAGRRVRIANTGIFILAALALIFMIPASQTAIFGSDAMNFSKQYLIQGLAWLGILVGLRFGIPELRAPFEWRWIRFVGLISFSLYLWHEFIIAVFVAIEYSGPGIIAWWLPLTLSIAISWVSFVAVEKPFLSINPSKVWLRVSST